MGKKFSLLMATAILLACGCSQQPHQQLQVADQGKPLGANVTPGQRRTFARHFGTKLGARDKGSEVTTRGEAEKTVVIKWTAVTPLYVREMVGNADMIKDLRDLGFKQMVLTDGSKLTWNVDLRN